MLRKSLSLVLAVIMVLTLVSCGSAPSGEDNEGGEERNFVYDYVDNMDPESREYFLAFWNACGSLCDALEIELNNSGITGPYEFDPTNVAEIPAEIMAIRDVSEIATFVTYEDHSDYIMKISEGEVSLSFDGFEFFPAEISYIDLRAYIKE